MDYDIIPLNALTTNWEPYIELCQKYLGISPVRGLDAAHVPITAGHAFLGSLSFDNKINAALANELTYDVYRHVFFSFAGTCSYDMLLDIATTQLRIISRPISRNDIFIIISGDLSEWKDALIRLCHADKTNETRTLGNKAYTFLSAAGHKDVWKDYKREELVDDTFIFRRRK